MAARALMILGTASSVGKSLVVTALCRHFASRGVRVAPFKAQNMSLNSAATPEGGEIGRAQALQAEAAGIAPSVDMNPILLKPTSDSRSQVIVQGRVLGTYAAHAYHSEMRTQLFERVMESYHRLAAQYELIILEGAGSPAEINLRKTDIVNMAMAHGADARCILVGDIDRGGVFAALLGTLELLDQADRERIDAFVINKFRGDLTVLAPGIEAIEPRLGIPCAGVLPYIHDVGLDDEDSVSFQERFREQPRWQADRHPRRRLRTAVVALPYLSNFTDFDALEGEPSVDLRYARTARDLEHADVVIVPGTKNTMADLDWLEQNGIAQKIRACSGDALIVGICGGLQMLGETIEDPLHMESGGSRRGLRLLACSTELGAEKITVPCSGTTRSSLFGAGGVSCTFTGYEIHLGHTRYAEHLASFAEIQREKDTQKRRDGAVSSDGRVIGTYVHGIFAGDAFRHGFLAAARKARSLEPPAQLRFVEREREERLNRLARTIAGSLNLDLVLPPRLPANA